MDYFMILLDAVIFLMAAQLALRGSLIWTLVAAAAMVLFVYDVWFLAH